MAFNSTGTVAYVTNQLNQNVGVIDVATNTQVDVIPVTGDPFELFVQPVPNEHGWVDFIK